MSEHTRGGTASTGRPSGCNLITPASRMSPQAYEASVSSEEYTHAVHGTSFRKRYCRSAGDRYIARRADGRGRIQSAHFGTAWIQSPHLAHWRGAFEKLSHTPPDTEAGVELEARLLDPYRRHRGAEQLLEPCSGSSQEKNNTHTAAV